MDRVNPQTNPTLAAGNTPAWFGPSGSPGRVTNLTGMDAVTGFSSLAGGTVTPRWTVTPGQPLASSVQVKPGFTGQMSHSVDFYSAAGYLSSIPGATVQVVNGTVQRVGVVGVVPAGAIEAVHALQHNGGPIAVTAHLPEVATALGTYFDGSTAATALQSAGAWDGTTGASTSRVTLLPQLVESYPSEASSGVATLTTAQFTPRQNEIILAYVTAGAPDVTLGAATAPGLTFVEVDASSVAAYTPYRLFRAVVGANPPSTSVTVSTTGATGTRAPTLIVERWSYAQLAASPALSTPRLSSTTSAPSATLTTVAANSALSWFCADYAGVSTATVTYRGTAVEKYRRRITSVINVWSAWQRATSPAAQTIGLSAPAGQKWAMVGVELQPGPAPVDAALPGTAAERYGWGAPLASSDEFTGGAVDTTKWSVYDGPGHAGNGVRSPAQVTVQDGYLRIAGTAGGASGGISHKLDQRFGRWECRMRCSAVTPGSAGAPYHPVLIIWPTTEAWPEDGEYDWVENDEGQTTLAGFLHLPHPGPVPPNAVEQVGVTGPAIDLTQWHAYAFEWISGRLKGYVDGALWFDLDGAQTSSNGRRLDSMPGGHLTIQLDNNTGTAGLRPATMDVDWARAYTVAESVPVTAVRPTSVESGQATGTPTITAGGVLSPAGIASGEQPGGHSVLRGAVLVDLRGTAGGSSVPGEAVPGQAVPGQGGGAGTGGGGIPTAEQAGAPAVTSAYVVAPAGIVSGEQSGGHTVFAGQYVLPAGIAGAEQVGAPTALRGTVVAAPAGLDSAEQLGGHSVLRGGVAVAAAGLASGEQPGGHSVLRGTVTVAAAGLASGEQLGGHAVLRGTVTAAPAGLGSAEQVGAPAVLRGTVTVSPVGLVSGEQPGGHQVNRAVHMPAGPSSAEAAGEPVVTPGVATVYPSGVGSGEQYGTAVMGVTTHVQPVPSGEQCGPPVVARGAVAVAPPGVGGGEHAGIPVVAPGVAAAGPAGVVSAEQCGVHLVLRGGVTIGPAGVASREQFGVHVVSGGPVTVTPAPAADGPLLGAPAVLRGAVAPALAGVESAERVSPPVLLRGGTSVQPLGAPSGERYGTPTLVAGGVTVRPAGAGSGAAVGSVVVARGAVTVTPAGVPGGEACGAATVRAHRTLDVPGVSSTTGTGAPEVRPGGRVVAPSAVGSSATSGRPNVGRGPVTVAPAGIASRETSGVPLVGRSGVHVRPAGVHAGGEVGAPVLGRGPVAVRPSGIVVVSVVPAPRVLAGARVLTPAGVPSGAASGTPGLRVHVDPHGIPAGTVGRPVVHGPVRRPGALAASWRTGGGLAASHTPT